MKEVKTISRSCSFNFPAKYEPHLNKEIISYIHCLPKNNTQYHSKIIPEEFFKPHWYTKICCVNQNKVILMNQKLVLTYI